MNSEKNKILPDSWTKASIEDFNFKKGESIDPSKESDARFELYSVPSFEHRKPEEIDGKDVGSTKQIVDVGDVLICKINPRINRVWIVSNSNNKKKIASSEWIVVNSNEFINSDYLRYAFSAPFFRLKLNSEVSGVGGSLTRARPKLVKDYTIPLAPLNEQNRIVEKLNALFARIDSIKDRMETIPELIKQFRQSVLHAAVTGKLTEEWRTRQPQLTSVDLSEKIEYRDYSIHSIPEQWNVHSFGDVAMVKSNLVSPEKYMEYYLIAPDNIESGTGKLISTPLVSDINPISPKHLFKRGQIVYSKIRPYLSKLIIAEFDGLCSADMYPIESNIDTEYLFLYMLSDIFLSYANTAGERTVLPKINQKSLSIIPVPIPSLEEQKEIVRKANDLFDIANNLENQFEIFSKKIISLPEALLVKAFKGELVPQDPNDEPAEKLLEKILEEKKDNQKTKKRE